MTFIIHMLLAEVAVECLCIRQFVEQTRIPYRNKPDGDYRYQTIMEYLQWQLDTFAVSEISEY